MSGCHYCGENHGTLRYFNVCAPKYRAEEKRRKEREKAAADELKGHAFSDGGGI